jgi:hypothetical protein
LPTFRRYVRRANSADAEIARLEQQIKHVAEQRQRMAQQIPTPKSRSTAATSAQGVIPAGTLATPAGWPGHRVAKPNSTRNWKAEPASAERRRASRRNATTRCNAKLQLQQLQLADTQAVCSATSADGFAPLAPAGKDNLPRPTAARCRTRSSKWELEMAREQIASWRRSSCRWPITVAQPAPRCSSRTLLAQTEARLQALRQLQQHIDNDKNLFWLQQHRLDCAPVAIDPHRKRLGGRWGCCASG